MFHVKQKVLTSDLLRDFDILANSRCIGVVLNHIDEFFNNIGYRFLVTLLKFTVILRKIAIMLLKYSSFLPKFPSCITKIPSNIV